MACEQSAEQVAALVLDVVRIVEKDPSITLGDSFEDDIGVDTEAKHSYFGRIYTRLAYEGCMLDIGPSAFDPAETVQDLADTVFGGIKRDDEEVAAALAVLHPSWASGMLKSMSVTSPANTATSKAKKKASKPRKKPAKKVGKKKSK